MRKLVFTAVAIVSLGLLSLVDDHVPGFVGPYRVASLAVCCALNFAVGAGALRLPRGDVPWRMILAVAGLWTLGTAVAVLGFKVWTPTRDFHGAADWVAFLFTGLVGEELLFRGAVFHLAAGVFHDDSARRLGPAVFASAVLFSVAHAQYHAFRVTGALAAQLLYTLPMGLVYGFVRKHTRSVWPAAGLHFACNAITCVGAA
jgi:membrane protease YdiL (CAAX protease family)